MAVTARRIVYQTCDVVQPDDISALVQCAVRRYGNVDVTVDHAVVYNRAACGKT